MVGYSDLSSSLALRYRDVMYCLAQYSLCLNRSEVFPRDAVSYWLIPAHQDFRHTGRDVSKTAFFRSGRYLFWFAADRRKGFNKDFKIEVVGLVLQHAVS
jgi:hypothetical protein